MTKSLFYVGTSNRQLPYFATANGKGIAAFELDEPTGAVTALGVTEGIDNPTFLAVDPTGRTLCATSEVLGWNEGVITAYAIDQASGALDYVNKQPTRGDIAAFLSYTRDGSFVASVNYTALPSSSRPNRAMVVYRRGADGELSAPVADVQQAGSGPDAARQDRSHAHCVRWTPDERFVVVADLGIDRLVVYGFDKATGGLTPHSEAVLPPGSGPRHFAFHPSLPFAYSVNELGSTVASFAFDAKAGTFALLALDTAVPEEALGHNHCSAIQIAPGGGHLYVGNRGHDSIGHFRIDPATGVARRQGNVAAGGQTPRDMSFSPSGTVLAVANQDSDSVAFFRFDAASGALTPLGAVATGTPTAIAFHPVLR